jgi:hypothetical protein
MATLFKYVAQFLLLPLIKEAIAHLIKYFKLKRERKELEGANKAKAKKYENSKPGDAHDDFRRLP